MIVAGDQSHLQSSLPQLVEAFRLNLAQRLRRTIYDLRVEAETLCRAERSSLSSIWS